MAADVILGRIGLADIRLITENHTQRGELRKLQLLLDKQEGEGIGWLPFYLVTEVYTQATGDAYPVGIRKSLIQDTLLHHTVHRSGYSEGCSVLGIRRIIGAVLCNRSQNLFLLFCCNHIRLLL